MPQERFMPDELKALVESGELTRDDLPLLHKADSLVAVDLMIKSGQMDVMGGPITPMGKMGSIFKSGARKAGLGRVPRGGGIVEGSGSPTVTSSLSHADDLPPNLTKVDKSEFNAAGKSSNVTKSSPSDAIKAGDEGAKRTSMFGGLNPESAKGNFPLPGNRKPVSAKDWEKAIQQLMKNQMGLSSKSASLNPNQELSIKHLEEIMKLTGGSGAKSVPGRGLMPGVTRRRPK